jgi:hypothetical protein
VKLPNGERAVVDPRKLLDYCLNPHHLRIPGLADHDSGVMAITVPG